MRVITVLSLAISLLPGCGLFGIGSHGGRTVNWSVTADGEELRVPLNVDGVTVGQTGDDVSLPQNGRQATFGDPTTTAAGVQAYSIPLIETGDDSTGDKRTWIVTPVSLPSPNARSAPDTGDMALDSATPPTDTDSGSPSDTATFVANELIQGTWTCPKDDGTDPVSTEVTYPDASSISLPYIGTLAITNTKLDGTYAPDPAGVVDGDFLFYTSQLDGVTVLTVANINVHWTDGREEDDLGFTCWPGEAADRPWNN